MLFYLRSFICLLLLVRSAHGQDSTIQYLPVHVVIKLAPLSLLLDPDATIQGGLEVRCSPRNSVQAEVDFGHKGLSVVPDEKQHFADWSIWRVRSEWRHYTGRYRTNSRKNIHIRSPFPLGNYLAIEGFAKQINATKNLVLYDPDPNFPNNQQEISRFVLGSHIKWGRQIAIPGQSLSTLPRVLLDFYLGVGARYGITELTPPIDTSGGGFTYDRFRPGLSNRLQPSLALGLKIGFGL
ncbi:hypothetical protein [Spirosoma luteum]|uniref:hypothetical protein n=1 Tax=Spirosoma luteum TaxID=431553 RepID=UPI000373232C|nr:hypothetical protein [Spirosoma luteum]